MILVIDVGNTSIAYAYFTNSKLVEKSSVMTSAYKSIKIKKGIKKVIYSSVVPKVDKYFEKRFFKFNFVKVDQKLLAGYLKVKIRNKSEVGMDRLVNAYGVAKLYKLPTIIIDFGTATTFCVINKKREYLGGLICPGINLSRLVLHEKTAKLPLINVDRRPGELIGNDTRSAMLSGIYFGYQSMIEGLIGRLKKNLKEKYFIVATGGYAPLICKNLGQKVDVIDQDLTLKALSEIAKIS